MDNSTALAESFNHKQCDVAGYEACWVRFATRGYPRRLRREWDKAGPARTLEIVTRYVEAWHIEDMNGEELELGAVKANALQRAELEAKINALASPLADRKLAERLLDETPDAMGETEDALSVWLIRTFQTFWITELPFPRKNS